MNINKPIEIIRGPRKDETRINEQIRAVNVRLIDATGENIGVVTTRRALEMAREDGLDLVEISPNVDPPVCKITDYGKHKYDQQKKQAEMRKKQKVVEVKEIKIRPVIEENDYQVKLRAAIRFFNDGNKVKVTMRFRGREMAHVDVGQKVLDRFCADLEEIAKQDARPKLEGRQIVMVLSPK